MDPCMLGTGSCTKKKYVDLVGPSAYSLDLFSLDSLEEYNILHLMLALTHYEYFQPSSLVHLLSPESQSYAADILVDSISIAIVLALLPFVFPSEPLILLQSLLSSLGWPQHYAL